MPDHVEAETWLQAQLVKYGIDWDKLTPAQRLQWTRQIPCSIRCWRIGDVGDAVGVRTGPRDVEVTGPHAAPGQRAGQLAGADADLRIVRAMNRAVDIAADNIGAPVIERGMINQPMHQHRPILHKTPHDWFPNFAGLAIA